MSIFVVGINHKTASVTLREKAYFALDKLSLYVQDVLHRGHAREAVLLSTCNRSELYAEGDDLNRLREWFAAQTTLTPTELEASLYMYSDAEALEHIMQVASGLDSMVLGESQILGQMKEAFSESCAAGAIAALFHRLFQQVFAVAKEIRTTTAIGACPVSVASAAFHFTKERQVDFREAKVVLIGAGDTSELLLRYLSAHLKNPITLVNRSMEKAQALAHAFDARFMQWDELKTALTQADIVFSATGSALPIVTKAMMKDIMQARAQKPILLMDIAVPRDIEETVAELDKVALYCIDDLKAIIEKNRQGREHAAEKAREMISQKSRELMAECLSMDKVAHTIKAYRSQVEEICHAELRKAKEQLRQGANPAQVLEAFASAFTKKLLHTPSVQLRQAGVEGRHEFLHFAKQLFAIPDAEKECV